MLFQTKDAIGFVYLWRDRKRKMSYIGSHFGSEYDGYICSAGQRFWRAYRKRPEDFRRRILERVYDGGSAAVFVVEDRWLQLIKVEELGIRYYNLKRAAIGIDSDTAYKILAKPEVRKRISVGVLAALAADPTITLRATASVKAARTVDPMICVRIGLGVKAAHKRDPTLGPRRAASIHAAHEADPTIGLRQGASIRATREADPSILQRQSASAIAAHIADPSILVRRGLAISAAFAADPTISERRRITLKARFEEDPTINERRGQSIRAAAQRKTPDERSEQIRKGWATRRAKMQQEN